MKIGSIVYITRSYMHARDQYTGINQVQKINSIEEELEATEMFKFIMTRLSLLSRIFQTLYCT